MVTASSLVCGQSNVPPCSAGALVTACSMAALTSSRPPPVSRTSPGMSVCRGRDEGRLDLLARSSSGWRCLTMAAAPATCGVAIDVPDMDCVGVDAPSARCARRRCRRRVPLISGFRVGRPSDRPAAGEDRGGTSSRSTAPTVSTAGAQPGAETVLFAGPVVAGGDDEEAVAAASESACAASAIGSSQRRRAPVLPRLMETTSAPCATAHSMPPMIPSRATAASRRGPCR